MQNKNGGDDRRTARQRSPPGSRMTSSPSSAAPPPTRQVHFSDDTKSVCTTSTADGRLDRILEANDRVRRHRLHHLRGGGGRSRQHQQQQRGRGREGSGGGGETTTPLSGMVRYLAETMERRSVERAARGRSPPSSPPRRGGGGGGRKGRPSSLPVTAARLAVMTASLAGIFVAAIQFVDLYSYSPSSTSSPFDGSWRRMQSALDAVRAPVESCVPPALPRPVNPTLTASYPGSGAKLTWKLVRALTGIMTGDDHDHNGLVASGNAVSVKTHYPALLNEDMWDAIRRIPRAMVLLRHPLNALPSYHNFEYERRHDLPNHSTRAPLEAWEEWRDGHFDEELGAWERHVRWYVEHYGPENRMVVLFERLSGKDRDVALEELRRVGAFLKEGDDRITLVDEQDLECVWRTTLADKRVNTEGKRRHSLRKGGPAKYPFRPEQLDRIEGMLKGLAEYRPGQLGPYMEYYLEMLRREREEMARPKDAMERGEAKEERALQEEEGEGTSKVGEITSKVKEEENKDDHEGENKDDEDKDTAPTQERAPAQEERESERALRGGERSSGNKAMESASPTKDDGGTGTVVAAAASAGAGTGPERSQPQSAAPAQK